MQRREHKNHKPRNEEYEELARRTAIFWKYFSKENKPEHNAFASPQRERDQPRPYNCDEEHQANAPSEDAEREEKKCAMRRALSIFPEHVETDRDIQYGNDSIKYPPIAGHMLNVNKLTTEK